MNHSLAQIGLRVADLGASIEHAEAILGVGVVDRDETQARLALPDRSPCLVLKAADTAALDYIGFLTEEANLAEIVQRADAAGVAVQNGQDFGAIRLTAPNRLAVEVAAGQPEPRNTQPREVGPRIGSLDHVSLNAQALDSTVAFFIDVLGFRLADSVGNVRHWLRCGPNHHTVAVFEGGDKLQHYAFETDDILELARLGDLLAWRGQNFLWGPGRHALGANIFTYHVDPSGAVLEVASDMIQAPDEVEWVAQVWRADTPDAAVMWGPLPTPGFREAGIPIHDHRGPDGAS